MELVAVPPRLHSLPGRFGPRPRTSAGVPFRQIDQFPPAEAHQRLFELALGMPGVRSRQSRVAPPQSCALYLPGPAPAGPPDAFTDDREFCHLHAPPEGSVHLTLPPAAVESIVALGWAERHPIHRLGLFR